MNSIRKYARILFVVSVLFHGQVIAGRQIPEVYPFQCLFYSYNFFLSHIATLCETANHWCSISFFIFFVMHEMNSPNNNHKKSIYRFYQNVLRCGKIPVESGRKIYDKRKSQLNTGAQIHTPHTQYVVAIWYGIKLNQMEILA